MADSAQAGETYRIKAGALAWDFHYNEQTVVAEESYGSPSAQIRVRCLCCGDTTRVYVSDLE